MGGRTPQAKRRQISRGTILDAAERLFAAHGRDGVTLKAIAAAADVDAALIRYYFGDKEAVFHEMFERRAVVLNGERHAAMDRMEARCGDAITVRDALDTFLRPMFETAFNRGQGWADFAAIAATINSSRAGGAAVMRDNFDPIVQRFIGHLRRAAPTVPDKVLYRYFDHLTGALTHCIAQTGRIDTLSGGQVLSNDMDDALSSLLTIFDAGFAALQAGD